MRAEFYDKTVTIKIEEGSKKPISLNQKSGFGKLSEDKLELSLIEALYLMEKGRLNLYKNDTECTVNEILEILKNNKVYGKYLVYKDLKDRGYIIKTGFKYGSDFRLYDRRRHPGAGHSDYRVKIIYENYKIPALDFASYIRVSHGVRKKLLLAIVDEDHDITYYNVEWTKP